MALQNLRHKHVHEKDLNLSVSIQFCLEIGMDPNIGDQTYYSKFISRKKKYLSHPRYKFDQNETFFLNILFISFHWHKYINDMSYIMCLMPLHFGSVNETGEISLQPPFSKVSATGWMTYSG